MNETSGWVMMWTQVSVPRSRDDIQFIWKGGNVAHLARGNSGVLDTNPYDVLSDTDPEVGDILTYGGYPVRCVANDERGVVLERIHS